MVGRINDVNDRKILMTLTCRRFSRNTGCLAALVGVAAFVSGSAFAASPHDIQRVALRAATTVMHDRAPGPFANSVVPGHCAKTST